MTVPAGRINRLFGTDGGVILSLYPAFPEEFDTETPLLVSIDGLDVPLYCERFERRGATAPRPHLPISTPNGGPASCSGSNSASSCTRRRTTTHSTSKTSSASAWRAPRRATTPSPSISRGC